MNIDSTDKNETIIISPQSKNHANFLVVIGTCSLLISFLLNTWFWNDYKYQLMLIMFSCLIMILIGILKFSEPDISYQLTRQYLAFYHRNGKWSIKWDNIVRIGTINSYIHGDLVKLPYIGIKLKNINSVVNTISPRLANKLIHEQKELLILAAKNREITLTEGLISFEPYKLNGKTYKGPIAAWLYRTKQLNNVYGYDLFIPETSFDRDLDEFYNLLNQCKKFSSVL
jgi:hypothetical protein